ncbi:SRPBCC family protein, partial [Chloroflexota bacterium]
MTSIGQAAIVNASIERIFSYIGNPGNWLEFWPSLMAVEDLKVIPNGGYSARWMYKMAGMLFHGTGEYTEVVPNQWFVIKTKGGINSTITWTFR